MVSDTDVLVHLTVVAMVDGRTESLTRLTTHRKLSKAIRDKCCVLQLRGGICPESAVPESLYTLAARCKVSFVRDAGCGVLLFGELLAPRQIQGDIL